MSYPFIKRLDPPIEVVTPLGEGLAHFLWVESSDGMTWGVCIAASGESWWFQNHQIRYNTNITAGRVATSPIAPMAGLDPHMARNGIFKKGQP